MRAAGAAPEYLPASSNRKAYRPMEKRPLGNTGLEVSVVGFGAMTIGGRFGPVDDAESNRALHAAIDGGMNFIDTSNAYGEGRSENLIGKFLKERPDRDDLILCTKGGNNFVALERGGWGRVGLVLAVRPEQHEGGVAKQSHVGDFIERQPLWQRGVRHRKTPLFG